MVIIGRFLLSAIIILTCLLVGKFIISITGIPFPGPILAMILLLVLLLTGIIKEQFVLPFASPLLNFMPLFFIPAGVGIIEHLGVINQYWLFLLCILIIIPLTSLLLISYIVQYIQGKQHD